MNSKPHRQNSRFQLIHFMAGDCKTADGAWSLMYGQKIDIEGKLRHAQAQKLRREAKIAEAEEVLADPASTKSQRLHAEADIIEQLADVPVWELNLQAAGDELADIQEVMEKLEPLRKYSHLSILEATEACQQEEWLLELQGRAENYLLSQGSIPADHLNTMRCHPEFQQRIVPHIQKLHLAMHTLKGLADGFALLSPNVSLLEKSK